MKWKVSCRTSAALLGSTFKFFFSKETAVFLCCSSLDFSLMASLNPDFAATQFYLHGCFLEIFLIYFITENRFSYCR